MIVILNFKNIGRDRHNFQKRYEMINDKINGDFLLKQVKPYLLSKVIDFWDNENGNLDVIVGGSRKVGEIEIIK